MKAEVKKILGGVKFWHFLVILGVVLVYKPVKRLVADLFALLSGKSGAATLNETVLSGLDCSGLTMSVNACNVLASNLLSAFENGFIGTDEDEVIRLMGYVKSRGDLNQIRVSFGLKRYFGWGESWFAGDLYILDQWFEMELGRDSSYFLAVQAIYTKYGELL